MESKFDISLEIIDNAVSRWEEAVQCITHGWDCIEEYCNDLIPRKKLAELVEACGKLHTHPGNVTARLEAADRNFIAVTEHSDLCVWHTGCQFQYHKDHIELCYEGYDQEKYWYYYRWQPD